MPKSTSDCGATGCKRLWPKVRLGDVCEVQRGGSPRPIKDYITDSPEGLNWIKIGDVEPTGKYITQTAEKIKPSGLNKTRKVSAGDFLLSNSMSFGRPYILKIDGCIHDGWLVLKEFSKTFTEDFFYYLLRSPVVQEQFDKLAHGSTVRNLNTDAVSRVSLPLPPLAEQKKIVEKVEKALKRVDALKAQFERMEKSAADYFKAALAETFAAVKGEKVKLGDVSSFMTSGSRGWAQYYADDGEMFITIKNVRGGEIDVGNVQHVHPPSGAETERTRVQANDLLISITADLGRTGVVTNEIAAAGAYINQHLICIRLYRDRVDPRFAALYIESPDGRAQIMHRNKEAVKAGLNFDRVKTVELPIPSLEIQREVVKRLTEIKCTVRRLEEAARRCVGICGKMRKAILAEAFQ